MQNSSLPTNISVGNTTHSISTYFYRRIESVEKMLIAKINDGNSVGTIKLHTTFVMTLGNNLLSFPPLSLYNLDFFVQLG